MKKIFTVIIIFFSASTTIHSQDLKAGEINIQWISGLTYQAKVYLYQNAATFINRPYIILHWGDGSSDTLSGNLTGCGDTNTSTNIYVGMHTYSGSGNYSLYSVDSFRIAGIQNISSSINETLILKHELVINPFFSGNNSPISLNCAHDFWECCSWLYNPGCYDSDGDSLSYKLVQPFTSNYTFPPASVDSLTGDMNFSPAMTGLYAFCMQIDEWRNISGTRYFGGRTYRQMLIDVNTLTSVNEHSFQNAITVYPNPFHSQTIFKISNKSPLTIFLYNINCKLVRTIIVNDGIATIERNELANGLYFYVVQTEREIIATGKLIAE